MNITEQLYNLIKTYQLDQCNCRFQKYRRAVELIVELVNGFQKNTRVLLIASAKADLEQFQMDCGGICNAEEQVIPVNNKGFLEQIDNSRYDKILQVSFSWHLELSHELHRQGFSFLDLYTYFLQNGLDLEHDYYRVFDGKNQIHYTNEETYDYRYENISREYFHTFKAYLRSEDRELKSIYLQRTILICLLARDFIGAKKHISLYCKEKLKDYKRYENAMSAIDGFIADIQTAFLKRPFEDILLFWLDELEYGEDACMPYLKAVSENGLTFENAYTVTPTTQATLKTLLCAKKVVDDKSYSIKKIGENSTLIQMLKRNGYNFYYCGPYYDYLQKELRVSPFWYKHLPPSMVFWTVLERMLKEEQPVFIMAHELFGSHWPLQCCDPETLDSFTSCERVSPEYGAHRQVALASLDAQVAFYTELLPKHYKKIFMSDHGWSHFGRFHTVLKLQGKDIPTGNIESLFSYIDFYKLVEYVIKPDCNVLPTLSRSYVAVQDVPYYDGSAIARQLKHKRVLASDYREILTNLGYHGVITQKMTYLKANLFQEECLPIQAMTTEEFEQQLQFCRDVVEHLVVDVEKDDKFKYSKYYYRICNQYFLRNNLYDEKKYQLIRQIFSMENVIYAIRTGGYTTMRLLLTLERSQREKIRYIIDQDPKCICAKFGYKVIAPQNVSKFKIDKIILPSYKRRLLLRDEIADVKPKVIDLYEYLEKNQIKCTMDFYWPEFIDSDFDVNFPFWDFVN